MPNAYFLIPGYGAQGGKAGDIALGFENGLGGIVNSSRGLMCAYKSDMWKDKFSEEQFAEATRAEAIRMRDELNSAIRTIICNMSAKLSLGTTFYLFVYVHIRSLRKK